MSQTITPFHLLAALAALYLPFVCVTDYHFRIGGFLCFFVVFEVSYLVVFGVWYQYLVAPDSHHPACVHPDNANIHSLQIHLLQLLPPHIKPSGRMSGKTLFALIRHLVCLSFLASIIT